MNLSHAIGYLSILAGLALAIGALSLFGHDHHLFGGVALVGAFGAFALSWRSLLDPPSQHAEEAE